MSGHVQLYLSLSVTREALPPTVLLAAVIGGVVCLSVDFCPPPSSPQASEVGKGLPRFVSATLRSHVRVLHKEIHKTPPVFPQSSLPQCATTHSHTSTMSLAVVHLLCICRFMMQETQKERENTNEISLIGQLFLISSNLESDVFCSIGQQQRQSLVESDHSLQTFLIRFFTYSIDSLKKHLNRLSETEMRLN